MKNLIFVAVFILFSSINLVACQFSVLLNDTYGDGWTGNSLTISVNGTIALNNITLSNGYGPVAFTFNANSGDNINVVFNQTGSYIVECSYLIKNPNDSIIFSEGPNISNPLGVSFVANCPIPTCSDGIMNGDETWIDCGGTVCNPCPPCGDGVMNGNETGVDCGGPDCPVCPAVWNINTVDGQTITTCSGTLYDSGGLDSNYANSENYSVTFCSGTSDIITLNISYDVENSYDKLYIYDGPNTSSPLIDSLTGGSSNITQFTSSTCVTIKFTSDGSVTKSGFSINISCGLNDEPCNAWQLTPQISCVYYNGTNATTTSSSIPDSPCGNYNGHDIWYKVIVPSTGEININTNPGTLSDMAMAVYEGSDCGNLILIDCNDDDISTMPHLYLQNLTPGSLIYIRLWDVLGDETGTFSICVINNQGPANCSSNNPASDFCTTATPICTLGGYCGNTSSAYTASEIPSGFCGSVENNSWLSFVASDTSATLNVWTSNCTIGDGIQMEIYATSNCTTFSSVSNCVSEGVMSDFQISTTSTLTIGETYYLMIDGWGGDVCDYIISANNGVAIGNPIVANINAATNNICSGDSVQLFATGGQYFLWTPSTGLSNSTIANPIAKPTITTQYTVKVYGNGVCETYDLDSILIYVSPEITVNEIITNATCFGSNSGSIDLSVSGLNPPFSYLWSNGAITEDLTNIIADTYSVDISDNSGCSKSFIFSVTEPDSLVIQNDITPENLGNDGSISITSINGGVTPYDILWSTGDTIDYLNSISAGIYNITITDSLGCILNQAFVVNNLGCTISTEISETNNPVCFNGNDGYAIASVQSGTEPYSYSWSTGQTTDTIENISSGMYFLTVTDFNSCITIDTIIINNPAQIVSNLYYSICSGDSIFLNNAYQHSNNVLYDTLVSYLGCDSILISNLTVVNPVYHTNNFSICNGDSIFLGNAYQNSNGFYYDTLSTSFGCDSIIINSLTVMNPVFQTNNINICSGDSIFLENSFQYSNGTFHDTLSTVLGCDSILTTNLTVIVIDTTVSSTDSSLYIAYSASNYQWLNCTGNVEIVGANSQFFLPNQSGSYSVEITKNGCIDTSGCHNIIISQISKLKANNEIAVYPNPADDKLYIKINANNSNSSYSIYSIDNRLINTGILINGTNLISVSKLSPGIYFTRVFIDNVWISYKIVINR